MPLAQTTQRTYRVYSRHVAAHHARTLTEASFEAAAVAYVEDLHDLPAEDEISVIVLDVDAGRQHCFRVDLASGETEPCG